MSDFNFPDQQQGQFQQQQMYQYQQPPKKSRPWWLLGCLGCLGLIVAICCCCVVGAFAAFTQPNFIVGFFGGSLGGPDQYAAAQLVVCTGSQAETYLNQMETDAAYFTTFTTSDTDDSDGILATGTIFRNGQSEAWSANFFVTSGGTFGNCIDRIEEN
jgi:hypothetical protein